MPAAIKTHQTIWRPAANFDTLMSKDHKRRYQAFTPNGRGHDEGRRYAEPNTSPTLPRILAFGCLCVVAGTVGAQSGKASATAGGVSPRA